MKEVESQQWQQCGVVFIQSDLGCLQLPTEEGGEPVTLQECDICGVSECYAVSVPERSIICRSTGRQPTAATATLKCDKHILILVNLDCLKHIYEAGSSKQQ